MILSIKTRRKNAQYLIFFCILLSTFAISADVEINYQNLTPVIVGPMNQLITTEHFTIANMGAAQDITFDIRYSSDNQNDYIGICDNIGCLTPPVAVSLMLTKQLSTTSVSILKKLDQLTLNLF